MDPRGRSGADLNAQDDDGLGWSTLTDARDPSRVRPVQCCLPETATAKPWSGTWPSTTTARWTSPSSPVPWPRTGICSTAPSPDHGVHPMTAVGFSLS